MTEERLRGLVAEILDARSVVINRGSEHGVIEGMRFAILNPRGQDIRDPETGERLGAVEISKTVVKVVRVQPKLSVARTFRKFTTPGGPLWSVLAEGWAQPPKTRVESLRLDESRLGAELDEDESLVKIGDPVVEIRGDDYPTDDA